MKASIPLPSFISPFLLLTSFLPLPRPRTFAIFTTSTLSLPPSFIPPSFSLPLPPSVFPLPIPITLLQSHPLHPPPSIPLPLLSLSILPDPYLNVS